MTGEREGGEQGRQKGRTGKEEKRSRGVVPWQAYMTWTALCVLLLCVQCIAGPCRGSMLSLTGKGANSYMVDRSQQAWLGGGRLATQMAGLLNIVHVYVSLFFISSYFHTEARPSSIGCT